MFGLQKNLSAGYLNEENITYTKLIFPLSLNIYWNGNAFNNLGYQEYSIKLKYLFNLIM